jgi:CHAD domain-containing protein
VTATDSFAAALRKALRRQTRRMRDNVAGAVAGADPEHVHDLRVATRRARFALRLAEGRRGNEQAAALRAELGWIAGLLGEARDLDVLASRLKRTFRDVEAPPAVRRAMARYFAERREEIGAQLGSALESERWALLLAALTGDFPGDQTIANGGDPAAKIAPKRILRAAKKLRRLLGDGPLRDAQAHHEVRIAAKRLRYTCEFFADLYDERLTAFVRELVRTQDELGAHHDAEVANARLQEIAVALAQLERGLSGTIARLRRVERARQKQAAAAFAKRIPRLRRRLYRLEEIIAGG